MKHISYHMRQLIMVIFLATGYGALAQGTLDVTPAIPQGKATEQFNVLMGNKADLFIDEIRFASGIDQLYENPNGLSFRFKGNQIYLNFVETIVHPDGFMSHLYNSNTGYGVITTDPVGNSISGFVHTLNGYYKIIPVDENGALIYSKDLASVPGYTEVVGTSESSISDVCSFTSDCNKIVDMLVLIPPDVTQEIMAQTGVLATWAIMSQIYSSVASAHSAMRNSGIPAYELRARLLSIDSFDYETRGSTRERIGADVRTIQTDYDDLRNTYFPDIVCLFTAKTYGTTQGIANEIGPDMTRPSMLVRYDQALAPRWTFAHELAHLHGARHNRSSNSGYGFGDDTDICAHAWRFSSSGMMDRTCLALAGGGNLRILHYSNPEIEFNGFATGTDDDNNSMAIRVGGCVLQAKYPPAFMTVYPSGTRYPCVDDGFQNLDAFVVEAAPGNIGHAPFTYEWSVISGNATNLTATGDRATVYFDQVGEIVVRVKVTSDDCPPDPSLASILNCVAYETITIEVQSSSSAACEDANDKARNVYSGQFDDQLLVFPNPTKSTLQVQKNSDSDVRIQLFDNSGKLVFSQTVIDQNTSLDVSRLTQGMYVCKLTQNETSHSRKLIIKK